MKTHYWLRRSAALLCLAAILPLNRGRAEEPPKAPETTPAAQPAAKGRPASPYVLEIAGGAFMRNGKQSEATLASVVDALRDIWPDVNIVLAPEVANLKLADLKLRSVGELSEALEALRVASGYSFEWRRGMPSAGGMIDPATGLPGAGGMVDPATGLPRQPAGESSLYVLDLGIDPRGIPEKRSRRMVEVFNLSGYLDHLPSDDHQSSDDRGRALLFPPAPHSIKSSDDHQSLVNRALQEIQETVLETLDIVEGGNVSANDRAQFKFHPGTRLLVVTGPPDAIEVALKVVRAMTGSGASIEGGSGPEPDTNSMAARDAWGRRYSLRMDGAPAPAQPAPPANPSAAPASTVRPSRQLGPDDRRLPNPSAAPANTVPPPRY
jgi:hypothetical protein